MQRLTSSRWCLLLGLFLAISLFPVLPAEAQPIASSRLYHPPLSYFALNAGLQGPLIVEARLSPAQFGQVQNIAEAEQAQLRRLLESSQYIVANPSMSLEQKRLYIQRSGYNRRVEAIINASYQAARTGLDPTAYARLVSWMERRWPVEVRRHSRPPTTLFDWLRLDLPFWLIPSPAPRTYEIFATRYNSNGRYTAALPDQCVKLTNGGLHTCADKGYVPGQHYEIFMSYKNGKKGVGVVVGETGPWNIDDNFWASQGDPTPRRMFADLPVGMPEAQAAFYNGYNGGVDQYGRKVTAPFAIDLAFKVADDLGLPSKTNDWINVSFMWTDNWGSSGTNTGGMGQSPASQPEAISPIATTAAKTDGSQVHTVQAGQTLWSIAVAYGTTIQRLRELNGLTAPATGEQGDVILPGQMLIVRPAGPTPTGDPGRSGLETRPATTISPVNPSVQRTERAAWAAATTSAGSVDRGTSAAAINPEDKQIGTPVAGIVDPQRPSVVSGSAVGDNLTPPWLFIIGGLVSAGLGLYLLGRWLSRT